MTIQRDILSRLLEELPLRFPGCGVLVGGSVLRRTERPDSDIDLFVVFDGDGPLGRQPEKSPEGIEIDLAVFPEKTFRKLLPEEWFNFWMFANAEIIHDPTGIAKRNQETAVSHFRDNAVIQAAWERQQCEVDRHKADPGYELQFPSWGDFSTHVKEMVTEPSAPGDAAKPRG